jgi:hypothetical protein
LSIFTSAFTELSIMRKGILLLLFGVGVVAALPSCRGDDAIHADPFVPDQSFVEQFDTMQNAFGRGWQAVNRSTPLGPASWTQAPGTPSMSAYSSRGTLKGAAYASYQSTAGVANGIISNWLVSPAVIMQNGDKIIFYTKAEVFVGPGIASDFGTRLQVRINDTDEAVEVGDGNDPGKFNKLLLDINANEDEFNAGNPLPTAYPGDWTRFEARIVGLGKPVKGRFAFRYYLHNAGTNGAGNGVGIDSVTYIGKK